jgi:ATP-binding cassette subfamily F protein uup
VLDEPTNDLDSETLELLEQRLVEYEGTALLVSHDRQFLNNVVTSTLVFEGDELREYVGGYDDWVRQRGANAPSSQTNPTPFSRDAKRSASTPITTTPGAAATKKLSYKDQRELDKLPALIEKLESRRSALHDEMAAPDFYKLSSATISARQAEERDVAARLAAAFARWEELESGTT